MQLSMMPPGVENITPSVNFAPMQQVNAEIENLDGMTVRNDFTDTIVRYIARAEKLVMWQRMAKRLATSDPVRDPKESDLPSVEFAPKGTLTHTPNAITASQMDLSDTGQALKALSGSIQFGNFSRSLYQAQGAPFGNLVAEKTDKMILRALRLLEGTLFTGDAGSNANEFNGLATQMDAGNVYTADITGATPDSLIKKLRSLSRLIMDQGLYSFRPTAIFCTGLGLEQIEEEVRLGTNTYSMGPALEVVPGVTVPSIQTHAGTLPIIATPFLSDTDGGASADTLHYYMIDERYWTWRGLYPYGGISNFNPQIFDVGTYTSSGDSYLLDKRMVVCYGTPYLSHTGAAYRLDVTVPSGTVGAI